MLDGLRLSTKLFPAPRGPMKPTLSIVAVLTITAASAMAARDCPPDSVPVGPICVDKYEASVWQIPPETTALVRKVQRGKATLRDLSSGGATQGGLSATGGTIFCDGGEYPTTFPANGQWMTPLYAASVSAVFPSGCVTWFQAQQACALSGKRLLTNEEWQRAVAGTPMRDDAMDGG